MSAVRLIVADQPPAAVFFEKGGLAVREAVVVGLALVDALAVYHPFLYQAEVEAGLP